ncbi:MAG: ComEA family DNA-binding protein, partial [Longimicrobiales bacterium]
MTPMESRGLLRGAALLAALSLVRFLFPGIRGPDPVSVDGEDRLPGLLAEAEAAREDQLRRAEPLKAGETLDPNRSSELELDRLPGVGGQLAAAIIHTRSEKGGFRRPEDLLEVPGIGPAKLDRIRPHLDFSRGAPLGRPPRVDDGLIPDDQLFYQLNIRV